MLFKTFELSDISEAELRDTLEMREIAKMSTHNPSVSNLYNVMFRKQCALSWKKCKYVVCQKGVQPIKSRCDSIHTSYNFISL